jgi:hypothetical protein
MCLGKLTVNAMERAGRSELFERIYKLVLALVAILFSILSLYLLP